MNFSLPQWVFCAAVDVLIKSVILTVVGLLVTLNSASIAGFVILAVFLSILHFICLSVAYIFVDILGSLRIDLHRTVKFLLVLALANALFALGLAAITINSRSGETFQSFGLAVGTFLAITNIMSILIAAAFGRVFRRA